MYHNSIFIILSFLFSSPFNSQSDAHTLKNKQLEYISKQVFVMVCFTLVENLQSSLRANFTLEAVPMYFCVEFSVVFFDAFNYSLTFP